MSRIFTATLDAVSSNKTKTVIKLSLTNKEAAVFAQRYLASIDKELHVSFEDPQLEMQFQQQQNGRPGLVATVNGRGEVEDVQRDADGGDGEGDLFSPAGSSFSDGSGDDEGNSRDPDPEDEETYAGKEVVIYAGNSESGHIQYVFQIDAGEATFPKKYVNGKCVLGMNVSEVSDEIGPMPIRKDGPTRYLIGELLGIFGGELRDTEGEGVPESDEMEFEDAGNAMDPDPKDDGADPEIDREQLEEYILEKQPTFDDIPFNFPMLLRRRRDENITWKDLAMEASTSTIRLQNFYTDYKQRVASKMKADGVA